MKSVKVALLAAGALALALLLPWSARQAADRVQEAYRSGEAAQASADAAWLLQAWPGRLLDEGRRQSLRALGERWRLSRQLAQVAADQVELRFAMGEFEPGGPTLTRPGEEAAPGAAESQMLRRLAHFGWADGPDRVQAVAFSPATGKVAFLRGGWVWMTDPGARKLRSVWYEKDLQARGRLEWSGDGTRLRLFAEGWRHYIQMEAVPSPEAAVSAGSRRKGPGA